MSLVGRSDDRATVIIIALCAFLAFVTQAGAEGNASALSVASIDAFGAASEEVRRLQIAGLPLPLDVDFQDFDLAPGHLEGCINILPADNFLVYFRVQYCLNRCELCMSLNNELCAMKNGLRHQDSNTLHITALVAWHFSLFRSARQPIFPAT